MNADRRETPTVRRIQIRPAKKPRTGHHDLDLRTPSGRRLPY